MRSDPGGGTRGGGLPRTHRPMSTCAPRYGGVSAFASGIVDGRTASSHGTWASADRIWTVGVSGATFAMTCARTSQKAVGTCWAIWLPYPLSTYLSWGVPCALCTPVITDTRNAGASAPRSTGSGSLDTWIPSRSGTSICHHHVPLASESRCSMRMVRSGASSPRGADSVASGGASTGPSAASRSSVSTTTIERVASPIACPPTAYSAFTCRARTGRSVGTGRSVRLTVGYGSFPVTGSRTSQGSSPPSTRSNPSASSWIVRS